jgi:hypothetical protein
MGGGRRIWIFVDIQNLRLADLLKYDTKPVVLECHWLVVNGMDGKLKDLAKLHAIPGVLAHKRPRGVKHSTLSTDHPASTVSAFGAWSDLKQLLAVNFEVCVSTCLLGRAHCEIKDQRGSLASWHDTCWNIDNSHSS